MTPPLVVTQSQKCHTYTLSMALAQLPSTSNRLSFFKSTLFWLICSSVAISHGVEKPAKPHYHTVNVSSLLPKPYCTGHTKGSSVGSRKMVVTSKRGPCSHIPRTKEISAHEESLLEDENRVRSLNNQRASNVYSKAAGSGSRIQISDPILLGGEYLTTIGLGTPKLDYQVIIDTGSDYTWVRCKPCSKSCESENLLFDPSKSSTYINGSCKPNSVNDTFSVDYYDKTNSRGHWACDKLSLEPSDVFERFQFGCGLTTDGGAGNFANGAGVLGLGRGDLSLVSQTASNFAKTFSYCLPKTSSSSGHIDFGDRARSATSSSGLKFTNLIEPPQNIPRSYNRSSLYFLELLGISVAGSRLDVPPTIFTSVGTVIDSGTVITYLPPSAYTALSKNFKQSMADYPPAPSQEKLDTCYNVKGYGSIQLPEITLHFGGATDVSLNPSGIVWIPKKNPYIWCLGFAATKISEDLTIIGNNQQRELDILYDIDAGKIGFGTKPCGD